MSKYIDADELIDELDRQMHELEEDAEADKDNVFLIGLTHISVTNTINNMPTADVVEVKRNGAEIFIDYPDYEGVKEITLCHKSYGCSYVEENTDRELHYGRWEVDDIGIKVVATCSVCRNEIEMPTCLGKPIYSYCPACGAKMVNEDE